MQKDIDDFLNYLREERGFSENTIEAYQNDLDQLSSFIREYTSGGDPPSDWSMINRQVLMSYITDLKERAYAAATISRKISAMKSLFKFLASKGRAENIPAAIFVSPQMTKNSRQSISMSEVQRLLAEVDRASTPEAKRDKAMLQLLYATGMRVSEIVMLDVDDVDIRASHVRCTQSNSQKRSIPLTEETIHAISHYLQRARPALSRDREEPALFLNRLGQRLTRQGLWQILKSHAEAANLGDKVTPRTLRHSAAFNMLRQGTDLRAVQYQLGHANLSTTQLYSQAPPPAP